MAHRSQALAVEPLTLKSGIAAPRSPVNNCGNLTKIEITHEQLESMLEPFDQFHRTEGNGIDIKNGKRKHVIIKNGFLRNNI